MREATLGLNSSTPSHGVSHLADWNMEQLIASQGKTKQLSVALWDPLQASIRAGATREGKGSPDVSNCLGNSTPSQEVRMPFMQGDGSPRKPCSGTRCQSGGAPGCTGCGFPSPWVEEGCATDTGGKGAITQARWATVGEAKRAFGSFHCGLSEGHGRMRRGTQATGDAGSALLLSCTVVGPS